MKKIFIIQSNYIPWKGYFDAINSVDEVILYDDMQYTKNDWRNRNKIKTAQGTQWLTIPIGVKGKSYQKINESKVSERYLNWRHTHWKSIQLNYSKAEYFKTYKDIFENLYMNNDEIYLSKINHSFIVAINEILQIKTSLRLSSEFNLIDGRNERLVDICNQVNATDYYSGPAARSYIDIDIFKKQGINVHYLDYSGYPEYTQLYGNFVHEVSIVDLVFNEGPNATSFMKTFTGKAMNQTNNISSTI